MPNNILFVFEGQKTEDTFLLSLQKHFLNENTIISTAFCTDLYSLYTDLKKDPDLDVFAVIKEKGDNAERLKGNTRDQFAEIYLFFDYDGHAPAADDNKVTNLLKYFCNETESGQLYLSFPMIESVKHLKRTVHFKDVVVAAKNNIKYKGLVHRYCDDEFRDPVALSHDQWKYIITEHCKKMNYIVSENYEVPDAPVKQDVIFNQQLERYITPHGNVAVLGSFPVFILDYYGAASVKKMETSSA